MDEKCQVLLNPLKNADFFQSYTHTQLITFISAKPRNLNR